ncbi:MAG: glycogen/starch synthase [Chloroflexota bacterium]
MNSSLKVLFLAAEADPLVKVGGLGDVAGSLPRAMRELAGEPAVDVRLVLPYHGVIRRQSYPVKSLGTFSIPFHVGWTRAEAWELDLDGLPVYLIGGELAPVDAPVYSQDTAADGLKFTFFSLAALELARRLEWQPQVVHANDWHTAPAVYALGLRRKLDAFYRRTVTLVGLHNLPYLGVGTGSALAAFGLPPAKDSALPWWAQDMPLPLALLNADAIVAVSPTYAQEILTEEFGSGLQDFLQTRRQVITGILNGLDVQRWNPESDEALVERYTAANLDQRQVNKAALQAEFNLPQEAEAGLMVMVTRLDHQKGVDLVPEALRQLSSQKKARGAPWQMIILGSGNPELEQAVRQLEVDFPEQVRTVLRFDAALSHRLYGGADMLLIPSRYEPCGLTQMIAMRYGCVPVARATGGLRDTIGDDQQTRASTGFLFEKADSGELAQAIGRALRLFKNAAAWRGMQERGMQQDFSWARFAQQYRDLYEELVITGGSADG